MKYAKVGQCVNMFKIMNESTSKCENSWNNVDFQFVPRNPFGDLSARKEKGIVNSKLSQNFFGGNLDLALWTLPFSRNILTAEINNFTKKNQWNCARQNYVILKCKNKIFVKLSQF